MKKTLFALIVLIIGGVLYAYPNPAIVFFDAPSQQRCCTIRQLTTGMLWNNVAGQLQQSVSDTNLPINLINDGNDLGAYYISPPFSTAGAFVVRMYDCNVANFASTMTFAQGYIFNWDGTREITPYYISGQAATAAALNNGGAVLLSSGTGAGQVLLSSGVISATGTFTFDPNSFNQALVNYGVPTKKDVLKAGFGSQ